MHLSSFCHPRKVIFTIKVMHDNLFIHSECSGRELVFHIMRRTYLISKHEYHIYLRCLLDDFFPYFFSDRILDRDRALGSLLWKDLPLSYEHPARERLLMLFQQTAGKGHSACEAIKSLMGGYQSHRHYFVWDGFARMAGVLVPRRLEAEIKTRTLLSTGWRLWISTKLIYGHQIQGKCCFVSFFFFSFCNWKNMQRSYFLWISQDLVTFTHQNVRGCSGERGLKQDFPAGVPALRRHNSSCSCWVGLPGASSTAITTAITRADKILRYRKTVAYFLSIFTVVLSQIETLWSIAKSHLGMWKQRNCSG